MIEITPKPKRRWFQYSVRTLLVVVTLCAVLCSWLAVKMRNAERQREAVAAIHKMGGIVIYDWQVDALGRQLPNAKPFGPAWLRSLLGDDFFASVAELRVHSKEFTDALLQDLIPQAKFRRVSIDDTNVTDGGLEHLKKLTHLTFLSLGGTQVTDAGLAKLDRLTELQILFLDRTRVTDAGMKHLRRLTKLDRLILRDTDVTGLGLENLTGLTRLQVLDLQSTKITDAALQHIKGLKQLTRCTSVHRCHR